MILKECYYIEKTVIRHVNDNLSDFSSSDKCDEEYMFFDKYLSWLLFTLLLTHKHTYKVSNVESYFPDLLTINQTPDKASHLSLKQKGHGVF